MVEYHGIKLDEKSLTILSFLYKNGKKATTDEITKETFIDDNDHVCYRYRNKLFPTNLLIGRKVQTEEHPRVWEVELTERAEEAIENGRFGDILDKNVKHNSTEARINALNDRIEKLEEQLEDAICWRTATIQVIDENDETDITLDDIQSRAQKVRGQLN